MKVALRSLIQQIDAGLMQQVPTMDRRKCHKQPAELVLLYVDRFEGRLI